MGYELTSFKSLEAACSQYQINNEGPVRLTLLGKNSYSYLNPIQDGRMKEILAKVGRDFEENHRNRFFNFHHRFAYVEGSQENDELVKDIFGFVNQAVENQTNGQCSLDLANMTGLTVNVAEDRSFSPPARAYDLNARVYEDVIERVEKAGVKIQKFDDVPENASCFARHIGQA